MRIKAILILTGVAWMLSSMVRASEPVTPAGGDSVTLAHKFVPGQVIRFRVYEHTTGTRVADESAATSTVDVEVTSVVVMRCNKLLDGGAAEIALRTESTTLSIAGRRVSSPPAGDDRVFVIGPNGMIRNPDSAGPAPKRIPGMISAESILLPTILPDQPVSVGASWTARVPMPLAPKSLLDLGFRFDELKQTPSGRIAVIKLALSAPTDAGASAAPPSAQGSQEGVAKLSFDVGRGSLQYAEGSIQSVLTTYSPMPRLASEEQTQYSITKYNLRSKFAIRRLGITSGSGT